MFQDVHVLPYAQIWRQARLNPSLPSPWNKWAVLSLKVLLRRKTKLMIHLNTSLGIAIGNVDVVLWWHELQWWNSQYIYIYTIMCIYNYVYTYLLLCIYNYVYIYMHMNTHKTSSLTHHMWNLCSGSGHCRRGMSCRGSRDGRKTWFRQQETTVRCHETGGNMGSPLKTIENYGLR